MGSAANPSPVTKSNSWSSAWNVKTPDLGPVTGVVSVNFFGLNDTCDLHSASEGLILKGMESISVVGSQQLC